LSNPANRQTDRQTDTGEYITSSAEVTKDDCEHEITRKVGQRVGHRGHISVKKITFYDNPFDISKCYWWIWMKLFLTDG